VGIDVGGTFTKAVAVEPSSHVLRAQAEVPTTHRAAEGVTEGVVEALELLLRRMGPRPRIDFIAFSTTQAMNALLEGDIPPVGVVGIGEAPDLRRARRRTRVGDITLAPGKRLQTHFEFLDATDGLDREEASGALRRLADLGCRAIAVSGAYAVEAPENEALVVDCARELDLPACPGHELSGAYGLETRTVSAAINAAVLPVVERTAALVQRALERAGLQVPLLVLRGDGGAMDAVTFRRRPALTIGSGPAAGVAAGLHQLGVTDAVVLECGGTSSNVSVVRGGRPALRSIRVMGRPTAIRSIDSWVVGAAGGSMARIGRRRIAETGPRSAHVAGLPYACFADPAELAGAELELTAPGPGDPEEYAVVRAGGRRFALTATCAANALGRVAPGGYAEGSTEAALRAFEPLARRLRCTPERAAEMVLSGATSKIAEAVAEAARSHGLDGDFSLVCLGGAAEALAPDVARRAGCTLVRPEHPEVLSSIGAALSLIRAEVARSPSGRSGADRAKLARAAERACVESGAAPSTVSVEISYEPDEGLVRAVATGAVALEAGAAERNPASNDARLAAAASALRVQPPSLSLLASNDFYRVYSENGSGRVAAVDRLGGVALAESARSIFAAEGRAFVERLREEIEATTLSLGISSVVPRVSVVCGSRILDLSDSRRAEEIVAAVEQLIAERREPAVAILSR
jgi:N-methylhydantoinase A/oxoprolinase/acetone carboxylase beta subunit